MELKPSSSMEIYLLIGFKSTFSFLIILFHSTKWSVVYVYVFFPNALFAINFKQSINHHKRKTENTLKEENYLKDML